VIWAPISEDRNLLYALSWNYAQDAKFAFDAETKAIVDLNPAAEAMTGYPRGELLGMRVQQLHPEDERERVKVRFREAAERPMQYGGFHIERKDGMRIPVLISTSETWALAGHCILVCVFRDITDQVEKQHRLAAQNWALKAYAGAALALGQARSEENLLQAICEAIARESVYLAAWIGMAEDGPDRRIRVIASAGSGLSYLEGLNLSWCEDVPEGQGPTGVCIRTNALQILEDIETSPVYGPWRERARKFGIRSSLSVPLSGEIGWHGALIVYAARPNAFEDAPVEVFQRLGEEVVHGVRSLNQERLLRMEQENLARTQAELTLALSGLVGPIIRAMEMRDPYTAGHQGRVAEIACAVGRELGWSDEKMHGLRLAAQVHDIGKISIPAEILTKPGKLNSAERAMIGLHPGTGHAILKDVPFAWPVAEIVLQHHEKLDGSGYPAGLKGDEILPEAKVLAVADMVEAMASFRPYRPGMEMGMVVEEIQGQAGRQLDAHAVHSCVSLLRDGRFDVPGWTPHEPARSERGVAVVE
jgi:PAS domain S-box-containing protein